MNEVNSRNNISILKLRGTPVEDLPREIVERKGRGHPDSLCDGIAERISQDYSKYCLRKFGFVLHHNFDKVQLVAGKANPRFGGGTIEKPIRIQIAGRGTPECSGELIPIKDIAVKAARTHLEDTLRYVDKGEFVIESYVGLGSCDLTELYARYSKGNEIPFANDTSFGFSHWPFSALEKTVLYAEKYVNSDLRDEFKQIGEDVKVFGVRKGKRIDLTVAIAVVDAEVKDIHQYIKLKDELQDRIENFLCNNISSRKIDIHINCADDVKNNSVYLTVTGTSGENGDDGSVGRGNRLNGLITPFRGMSLEAVAGKNPISHIGKVYNVLSILTAQKLVKEISEVKECSVLFAARIGDPIDKPRIAHVTILPRKGVHLADIRHLIENSVEDNISKVTSISNKIVTDGLHFVEDLLCPSR
jgi:S-adenosylmethionine synthetase